MKFHLNKALISLLLCIPLLLLFVSCDTADKGEASLRDPAANGDGTGGYSESITNSTEASSDRKIIKTVNEEIETEQYDTFIASLKSEVNAVNGYISSSYYKGDASSSKNRTATFEIRIPAEKLDVFTGKVGGLATVVSYTEKQSDITLAYVDVESRIAVLEAEHTALLDILRKSSNTSEMLQIRSRLENVQSDLASLKAQIRVYNDQIAYSTVNLSVREVERETAPVEKSFFSELGATFMNSLYGVWSFLKTLGLFLIGGSPYLLLFGGIGTGSFFIYRAVRKHRGKKKS